MTTVGGARAGPSSAPGRIPTGRTMTIVSHSRQFIFIKARKVASSSVLATLGGFCGAGDIVTAPGDTEGLPDHSRNATGLRTHSHPDEIRRLVSPEQWRDYTKITCIRNPWDVTVSMLLWRYYRGGTRWRATYSDRFRNAIATRTLDLADPEYRSHMASCIADLGRNCRFYLDATGTSYADVHLRHEQLQQDFDALCERLGVPARTLPRLKSQSRPADWHYRDFFDDALREDVARAAAATIGHFGYRF